MIAPGVEHWHGAAPDSWFTHIGMILNETKPTASGPDISPEEYQQLIRNADKTE